jgi:plastocyanin
MGIRSARLEALRRVAIHLAVATTIAGCRATPPGLHRVTTQPAAFDPPHIQIAVGDSVEWAFGGTHDVTFAQVDGRPADIPASPEGRYVRRFPQSGTFPYRCTLHPGMVGEVAAIGRP